MSLEEYLRKTFPAMLHVQEEMKSACDRMGFSEAELIGGLNTVYRTRHVSFKKRLEYFYDKYCKHKAHNAEWLAVKYKADPETLMSALVYQYGPEPRIPQRELPLYEKYIALSNRNSFHLLVCFFARWKNYILETRVKAKNNNNQTIFDLSTQEPYFHNNVRHEVPNGCYERRSWEDISKSQRELEVLLSSLEFNNQASVRSFTEDYKSETMLLDLERETTEEPNKRDVLLPERYIWEENSQAIRVTARVCDDDCDIVSLHQNRTAQTNSESLPETCVMRNQAGRQRRLTTPIKTNRVANKQLTRSSDLDMTRNALPFNEDGRKCDVILNSKVTPKRTNPFCHNNNNSGQTGIPSGVLEYVDPNRINYSGLLKKDSVNTPIIKLSNTGLINHHNYDMLSMPVIKNADDTDLRAPASPVHNDSGDKLDRFVTNLLDSLPDFRHPDDGSSLSLSTDCGLSVGRDVYDVPDLHFS